MLMWPIFLILNLVLGIVLCVGIASILRNHRIKQEENTWAIFLNNRISQEQIEGLFIACGKVIERLRENVDYYEANMDVMRSLEAWLLAVLMYSRPLPSFGDQKWMVELLEENEFFKNLSPDAMDSYLNNLLYSRQ